MEVTIKIMRSTEGKYIMERNTDVFPKEPEYSIYSDLPSLIANLLVPEISANFQKGNILKLDISCKLAKDIIVEK